MTRVVHVKEPYDVYIGRRIHQFPDSIWGNPYVIGRDGTREEAIAKYREYILGKPELLAQLETLRGKRLGCWCSPQKCHGDVLVELLEAQQVAVNSLGKCCKCSEPASLKSPSGNPQSVYCRRCGRCGRKEYDVINGYLVLREECKNTIEDFVLHPRMKIWVCPCLP